MKQYGCPAAATFLGLSEERVRQLIREHQASNGSRGLRAEKLGRDWIITERELTRFAGTTRPPGRPARA